MAEVVVGSEFFSLGRKKKKKKKKKRCVDCNLTDLIYPHPLRL